MDTGTLIASTGCAAFGADADGRILTWNRAAEEMLGHSSEEVIGRPCHEVVCGHDLFGNRFCDCPCSVHNMARRGEPVYHFEMHIRHASGAQLRAGVCTLVLGEPSGSKYQIVHLFQPAVGGNGVTGEDADSDNNGIDRPNHAVRTEAHEAPLLTPREMEVLKLLNQGEPTRSISTVLDISVTTVRNHIQGILRKLGAHSRLEAVSIARRHGLL